MVNEVFNTHSDFLSKLNYQLDEEEALKVAEISSYACTIDEDGVYLLILYLNQSRKHLWNQGTEISVIQEKMNSVLNILQKQYRPG